MTEQKKEKKQSTVTVELAYPIEWGEETITAIELRRPKAKDIEHLAGSPSMKDLLLVAGKISGKVPRLIQELDATDALKLCEVVGDFLDTGRATGKTDLQF